jgi:hypothetical protein
MKRRKSVFYLIGWGAIATSLAWFAALALLSG